MNKKILFALLILLPGLASATSFDCDKAVRPLDKAICAQEQLSALDEQMADYCFTMSCSGAG